MKWIYWAIIGLWVAAWYNAYSPYMGGTVDCATLTNTIDIVRCNADPGMALIMNLFSAAVMCGIVWVLALFVRMIASLFRRGSQESKEVSEKQPTTDR